MGVLLALAGIELLSRPELTSSSPKLLLAAALMPTLLWRRSHPLTVVAVAFGQGTVAVARPKTVQAIEVQGDGLFAVRR